MPPLITRISKYTVAIAIPLLAVCSFMHLQVVSGFGLEEVQGLFPRIKATRSITNQGKCKGVAMRFALLPLLIGRLHATQIHIEEAHPMLTPESLFDVPSWVSCGDLRIERLEAYSQPLALQGKITRGNLLIDIEHRKEEIPWQLRISQEGNTTHLEAHAGGDHLFEINIINEAKLAWKRIYGHLEFRLRESILFSTTIRGWIGGVSTSFELDNIHIGNLHYAKGGGTLNHTPESISLDFSADHPSRPFVYSASWHNSNPLTCHCSFGSTTFDLKDHNLQLNNLPLTALLPASRGQINAAISAKECKITARELGFIALGADLAQLSLTPEQYTLSVSSPRISDKSLPSFSSLLANDGMEIKLSDGTELHGKRSISNQGDFRLESYSFPSCNWTLKHFNQSLPISLEADFIHPWQGSARVAIDKEQISFTTNIEEEGKSVINWNAQYPWQIGQLQHNLELDLPLQSVTNLCSGSIAGKMRFTTHSKKPTYQGSYLAEGRTTKGVPFSLHIAGEESRIEYRYLQEDSWANVHSTPSELKAKFNKVNILSAIISGNLRLAHNLLDDHLDGSLTIEEAELSSTSLPYWLPLPRSCELQISGKNLHLKKLGLNSIWQGSGHYAYDQKKTHTFGNLELVSGSYRLFRILPLPLKRGSIRWTQTGNHPEIQVDLDLNLFGFYLNRLLNLP